MQDSGLLELMSRGQSAVARACNNSGHLSAPAHFWCCWCVLTPARVISLENWTLCPLLRGLHLYWLYWIMWRNIDLHRDTCYCRCAQNCAHESIRELKYQSCLISLRFLSEADEYSYDISWRYVFSTPVSFSLQTPAGSWLSQTLWSGVENSSSLTTWTLIMLLLSGKQKQTHMYTHTHIYSFYSTIPPLDCC